MFTQSHHSPAARRALATMYVIALVAVFLATFVWGAP